MKGLLFLDCERGHRAKRETRNAIKLLLLTVLSFLYRSASSFSTSPMALTGRSPFCKVQTLGLKESLLTPSSASRRAYSLSKRAARGKFTLDLQVSPLSLMTEFHVLDIKATFNPFLGRLIKLGLSLLHIISL